MTIRMFFVALLLGIIMPAFTFSQIAPQAQNPDTTTNVKQKDLIDIFSKYIKFHRKHPGKERKVYFSFLPLSGATDNGNRFLVTSFNATFRLREIDSSNLSSVYFTPYPDLSTRFGF